jgi:hypothetical protein
MNNILCVRFKVFMAVKTEFVIFWVVELCSVVVEYQPTLKMEAAQSSETLVSNHHTTWCNNPRTMNVNILFTIKILEKIHYVRNITL